MSSLEQKENFPAFRSQLLESLKAGGTLDTLKTQVRGHLLQEIRRKGLLRAARPARDVPVRQRALDSLVLDHLAACGYAYSLSVFAPECGLGEAPLTRHDACAMPGLPAAVAERLEAAAAASESSPLAEVLASAAELSRPRSTGATQTAGDIAAGYGGALEAKLRRVDEAALARPGGGGGVHALEEHMLKFQREADERAAYQLRAEVRRIREVESRTIREEEGAKARAEMERALAEMHERHTKQIARLASQEAEAVANRRRKEAEWEAECYETRQAMQRQMESMRERERLARHEAETRRLELLAQAEQVAQAQVVVKEESLTHERQKSLARQRVEDELVARQRERDHEYEHKMAELRRREASLVELEGELQKERERVADASARQVVTAEQLADTRDELRDTRAKLVDAEAAKRSAGQRASSVGDESALLRARLSDAEEALAASTRRVGSLTQQLAEMEQASLARQHESSALLAQAAAALERKTAELHGAEADHDAQLRAARAQTQRVVLEQGSAHEMLQRDATLGLQAAGRRADAAESATERGARALEAELAARPPSPAPAPAAAARAPRSPGRAAASASTPASTCAAAVASTLRTNGCASSMRLRPPSRSARGNSSRPRRAPRSESRSWSASRLPPR